ncbi:hypothetical protein AB0I28_28210 [Phytomonospora sp. NPDC050363]|uniref:hypothetical protein n=1 Tax=Phytomonospora sp. NPDC050363 TaxID=3155642 RepID=UPI0033DC9D40
MRRITRLLFTRYGIVGAIVLIVVVVLTVSRAINGPGDSGSAGNNVAGDETSSPVQVPDDGVVHSSGLPTAPQEPALTEGAEDLLSVAGDFAQKWAQPGKSAQKWHDSLGPLSTEELKVQLAGVDPISVPTNELLGEPELSFQRGDLAEVTVSAVGGTLRLSLTVTNGQWLVSGIDWERG